tara:strand:+ start:670 stop:837 length:168 start_codon:yes stop_codon:yes gene_type:complete
LAKVDFLSAVEKGMLIKSGNPTNPVQNLREEDYSFLRIKLAQLLKYYENPHFKYS